MAEGCRPRRAFNAQMWVAVLSFTLGVATGSGADRHIAMACLIALPGRHRQHGARELLVVPLRLGRRLLNVEGQ